MLLSCLLAPVPFASLSPRTFWISPVRLVGTFTPRFFVALTCSSRLLLCQWIALIRLSRTVAMTGPAVTHPSVDPHIVTTQRMAFRAMSLPRALGGQGIATQRIHSMCHKLKVIGVYARRVAAQVVYFTPARSPLWKWPNPQFVGEPMGTVLATINNECAVRTGDGPCRATSRPEPTRATINTATGLRSNVSQETSKSSGVHITSI